MPRVSAKQKNKDDGADGGVRTLLVAAKILDAVAHFRGEVRLVDLARMLHMTLPRVSRHVATLRSLGFLEKAEPLEAYRLGTKLLTLGQVALDQSSLASVAYTHIGRLRDQVGRTILLVGNAKEGATVLMCFPSRETTTLMVHPGTILDYPSSPSARLIRAFGSEEAASAGAPSARLEIADSRGETWLETRIHHALANFCDFEVDVQGDGFGSIVAPIFDHHDHIVAVVSLVMTSSSFNGVVEESLTRAVKDCAARISSSLGSTAWDRRRVKAHAT